MSNRVWGLLILWIIFGLGYLFYWYYFVYSLVNITFNTNVEAFTISMESTQKKYDFECDNMSCDYEKISPFEYSVTLQAVEYKDITFTWKPTKKSAIQTVNFQKDYKLEAANLLSQDSATQILNETVKSSQWETIEEKIQKLKDRQQNHLIIKTENNTYTFKKNNRKLSLYENDILLWNFEYADKSEISLQEVISNQNYLDININDKKYLYSKLTGKLQEYTLKIPINYIKSTDKNWEFIFVTQKWSFVYNLYENIFQYNSYFSDFVFFNKNSLVGIINTNDLDKLHRFNIENNNKNLIVSFTPKTKEQIILLETDKNIVKIFKKDGKIYLEDDKKNIFSISHLAE